MSYWFSTHTGKHFFIVLAKNLELWLDPGKKQPLCVSHPKRWFNEPFSGSHLCRKLIDANQAGTETACICQTGMTCLSTAWSRYNFILGSDISSTSSSPGWQGIRSGWVAFCRAVHSSCPLWFVFLLFTCRPFSKWPVNSHAGDRTSLPLNNAWTSDVEKPSRYVNNP